MAIHTYNLSLNSAKGGRVVFFLFLLWSLFFSFTYLLAFFVCLLCFIIIFFLSFAFLLEEKFYFSIFCSFFFLKMACDSVFELFLYVILCECRISVCRWFLTYIRVLRWGLCFSNICNNKF